MKHKLSQLKETISHVVIGKEKALELVLVGLLAEGHILIDDVPGMGKTLLAKSLAASLACEFKRIQFTPDLTPTDVTGFFFYDHTKNFTFRPGPVLTNVLLADEINRTVPRTQSALLEAMEERQITVDGQTMALPKPFLVLATQNPIDQEGTFPLPEAQLDRFLLKIDMGYPSFAEEAQILELHQTGDPLSQLQSSIAGAEDVLNWQHLCHQVTVRPAVSSYLITLIRSTREHPAVALGASPRATVALYRAIQALAFLRGRDFATPDDVKYLVHPVLSHRLILRREERLRGLLPGAILEEILQTVSTPVETVL